MRGFAIENFEERKVKKKSKRKKEIKVRKKFSKTWNKIVIFSSNRYKQTKKASKIKDSTRV